MGWVGVLGKGIFVGFTHIQFQGLKLSSPSPRTELRQNVSPVSAWAAGVMPGEATNKQKGTWPSQSGLAVPVRRLDVQPRWGHNIKAGGGSHLNSSVQSLGFGLMSWEAGVDSWLLAVCACMHTCWRTFPTTKSLCAHIQVGFAKLLWPCTNTDTHFLLLSEAYPTLDTPAHANTGKVQGFGFYALSATETGENRWGCSRAACRPLKQVASSVRTY